MDIKIRTQAKGKLVDCTRKTLQLGGRVNELNQVIAIDNNGPIILGTYKDMDRATEIIDYIQTSIEMGFKQKDTGTIILMPEE